MKSKAGQSTLNPSLQKASSVSIGHGVRKNRGAYKAGDDALSQQPSGEDNGQQQAGSDGSNPGNAPASERATGGPNGGS
jgi:hypothetical protein